MSILKKIILCTCFHAYFVCMFECYEFSFTLYIHVDVHYSRRTFGESARCAGVGLTPITPGVSTGTPPTMPGGTAPPFLFDGGIRRGGKTVGRGSFSRDL